MTIVFDNKEHGQIIADAIPRRFNPACDPVLSNVNEREELLGGVVYDSYTGSCVFIHQAGFNKHWMSRDMLWVAFDYPFNQLGVRKLCGTIPSTNQALLDINLKLGFIIEHTLEDGYPDGPLLLMSMTRDQCRWLKLKPRKIRTGYGVADI